MQFAPVFDDSVRHSQAARLADDDVVLAVDADFDFVCLQSPVVDFVADATLIRHKRLAEFAGFEVKAHAVDVAVVEVCAAFEYQLLAFHCHDFAFVFVDEVFVPDVIDVFGGILAEHFFGRFRQNDFFVVPCLNGLDFGFGVHCSTILVCCAFFLSFAFALLFALRCDLPSSTRIIRTRFCVFSWP